MCTVIGAVCKFECFQTAQISVHIPDSINHKLIHIRQLHMLEMIIGSNYCFIHLYAPRLCEARNMDEFLYIKTVL